MQNALFSKPDAFAIRALELLSEMADKVMPMNGAQRRDLPAACRDLSALLTTERSARRRPYWTAPRLVSAYLRYFLPWNLVRLSSLLPNLPLNLPPRSVWLDLGSGPLTLPMALWISRPDLRHLPLTVVASDNSPHILELGRKFFEELRKELDPESPWTVRILRASVSQALHKIHAEQGAVALVSLGNVLNEMEDQKSEAPLAVRLRRLLESSHALLGENGLLCAVEPGTRLGGKLIGTLRQCALQAPEEEDGMEEEDEFSDFRAEDDFSDFEEDEDEWTMEENAPLFEPLSPCPHANACPLLTHRTTAWCHATTSAPHAPKALKELSFRAGLDKDNVSLSFVLLKKIKGEELRDTEEPIFPQSTMAETSHRVRNETDSYGFTRHETRNERRATEKDGLLQARVLSDAFPVPGLTGLARYACTEQGLALLPDAASLPSGFLCQGIRTKNRDDKSGAFLLAPPPEEERPRPSRKNENRESHNGRPLVRRR